MKHNNIELKEDLAKLKESNKKILDQINNMIIILDDLQNIIAELQKKIDF